MEEGVGADGSGWVVIAFRIWGIWFDICLVVTNCGYYSSGGAGDGDGSRSSCRRS